VVDGDVVAGREAQAEQALGAVEGGQRHAAEFEIGLDLGVVDGVTLAPHLLGPETPVPGLDLARLALAAHHLQQCLAFAFHGLQRRRPHLRQQLANGRARAGHGVGEGVVGVAGVAVQPRLLVAQAQDVARDLAVVVLAVVFATADPGPPGLFTQVSALREGEEGHHQRTRQRHHVARQAAVGRRLARVGAHEVGQPGQVGIVHQRQLPGAFVVQYVLRKARRQAGQRLHHLGVAGLVGARQARAGAHEIGVHALKQALLLGVQAQRGTPLV